MIRTIGSWRLNLTIALLTTAFTRFGGRCEHDCRPELGGQPGTPGRILHDPGPACGSRAPSPAEAAGASVCAGVCRGPGRGHGVAVVASGRLASVAVG